MADYFVQNRSNPVASAHRAGVRYSTIATDANADVIRQYAAAHPVAAGDVMEVVSAGAFVSFAATATITYSPAPAAPLPPVGS